MARQSTSKHKNSSKKAALGISSIKVYSETVDMKTDIQPASYTKGFASLNNVKKNTTHKKSVVQAN